MVLKVEQSKMSELQLSNNIKNKALNVWRKKELKCMCKRVCQNACQKEYLVACQRACHS